MNRVFCGIPVFMAFRFYWLLQFCNADPQLPLFQWRFLMWAVTVENKSEVLSDIQKMSIICLLIAICAQWPSFTLLPLYLRDLTDGLSSIAKKSRVASLSPYAAQSTMYVLHFIPFSSCYNFKFKVETSSILGLATAAANFDSLLRSLVIVKRHLKCV